MRSSSSQDRPGHARAIARIVGVSLFLLLSGQATAEELRAQVPCRATGQNGCASIFRLCASYLPELFGPAGVIETRARQKAGALYQGIDIDFTISTDPENAPRGTTTQVPVCNVVPGEYNGQVSELTESLHPRSRDCGRLAYIQVDGDLDCGLSGCSYDVTVKFRRDGLHGRREDSWLRGARVQGVSCFKKQIENEIRSGLLRVSPSCREIAVNLNRLQNEANQIFSSVQVPTSFCSQPNGDEIDLCAETPDFSALPVALNDTDIARILRAKQSACYLSAARASIEAAFKQLALCELVDRSDESYRSLFGSELGRAAIRARLSQEVEGPCKTAAESCDSTGCAERKANACYAEKIGPAVRKLVEEKYPNSGECSL